MSHVLNKDRQIIRLCLLIESYHPVVGGGETQARMIVEDLIAENNQVIVITRRSNHTLKKVEQTENVAIYRVDPVGKDNLKKWALLFTSLPILLKQYQQYDLIFVSGFRTLGIIAVIVGKLFNKPCILKADCNGEMSGDFFTTGLAKWNLAPSFLPFKLFLLLRNQILKQADYFISLSSDISEEMIAYGVNQDQINLIPNSVDTKQFYSVDNLKKSELRRQLSLPLEDKIVIFTGRLLDIKGLPLLVRVWKKLQSIHQHSKLLIVGGGSKDLHDCEANLKEYVDYNGLQNSVCFTGNVTNVSEYLQASDIFVFPTENEAFGISLIEAMACGLPVISTPVGGIKEILTHGQNGLMVEVGNFEQLHDSIQTLITDDYLSASLGKAALQTVRNRYSRETIAKKYIELFKQC